MSVFSFVLWTFTLLTMHVYEFIIPTVESLQLMDEVFVV
jgi:hypothetical protein